ncbi:MAG: glycosyltransferase family 4 protein [Crocinitomicaceae bacterium]
MKNLRVLHIVPWFPNPENTIEGVFIASHIKALQQHCENSVLHIKFTDVKKDMFCGTENGIPITRIEIKPLIDKWRLKELLAANRIKDFLSKKHANYDMVLFSVAYPNAINLGKLKQQFKTIKFVLVEHWSAYHTQFNLAKNNSGRNRIESIFSHSTPLIVVSNALGDDIKLFTGFDNLKFDVIPNIVDHQLFFFKEPNLEKPFTFCSINNWSEMKNPFLLIDAFNLIQQKHTNVRLILAGSGNLDEAIKEKIKLLRLENKIQFLGRVSKEKVASILKEAHIYCQSSNYETFSVICIEALSCGTPVLATNIGGVKDYLNNENGHLVDTLESIDWADSMERIMLNFKHYNLKKISEDSLRRFNSKKIGRQFYDTLLKISDEK